MLNDSLRNGVGYVQPDVAGRKKMRSETYSSAIKRVIAVDGDVIEGRDLNVLLNGKLLDEPYIEHIGMRLPLVTFGPMKVPPGSIFVAGDNRDYSLDGRDPRFGLVSIADVKGKPLRVLNSSIPKRILTLLQ